LPESARGLLIYFRQRRIFTERLEDTDDIAIGSCRSRRRFEVAQRGRAEGSLASFGAVPSTLADQR